MPDARDLIRQRRQQTESTATERTVERAEQTQRTDTGASATYRGRNPATGELQVRVGDRTVSGRGLSNSELAPGDSVQLLDTGVGQPGVNFPPSPPERERPVPQPSEELTGTIAVLLDTVVEGSPETSCQDLQDIWALFAIVQYVKAARCLVMFSFPNETGAPVPYSCPRYKFGQITGGVYACSPTPDPAAPYGSYQECVEDNPVSCPGSPFGEGQPINPDTGAPEGASAPLSWPPFTVEILGKDQIGFEPLPDPSRVYLRDNTVTLLGGAQTTFRIAEIVRSTEPPIDIEQNPELLGTITFTTISTIFFDENGRFPVCGDTITVDQRVLRYTLSGQITMRIDGGTELIAPYTHSDWQLFTESRSYSYQPRQGSLAWFQVLSSNGCGDYTAVPPLNPVNEAPVPSALNYPQCEPPEGTPTTIERQFWVGGHISTPVFLTSINEEEDYEFFGSLMADGYYVTVKHGRDKVGSTERWCKIETFKTTNFVDWRTAEYHESLELQPPLPGGQADGLITFKNDRANLTRDGIFEIDPEQELIGSGTVARTLRNELLIRPNPPDDTTLINASLEFTPTGSTPQAVSVGIHRIVDVIPTDLDQIDGQGCVEVGGVELAFSPLFILPEV